MLHLENLHVSVDDKQILNGLSLTINPGEVHAIMGPNASGKSTLANILTGRDGYQITQGKITYQGLNLAGLLPEERCQLGIFMAFQDPIEIPGVTNIYFLNSIVNEIRKKQNLPPLDAMDFNALIKNKMAELEMNDGLLYRAINEGFSGGEKKRNEILQMILLEPTLIILDETDSGLDIDALQIIAKAVNRLKTKNRSFIVITHYQRLLEYIQPDRVHILANGTIIKSGDKSLALDLEKSGYQPYLLSDETAS